jgi:hypothetical protein
VRVGNEARHSISDDIKAERAEEAREVNLEAALQGSHRVAQGVHAHDRLGLNDFKEVVRDAQDAGTGANRSGQALVLDATTSLPVRSSASVKRRGQVEKTGKASDAALPAFRGGLRVGVEARLSDREDEGQEPECETDERQAGGGSRFIHCVFSMFLGQE